MADPVATSSVPAPAPALSAVSAPPVPPAPALPPAVEPKATLIGAPSPIPTPETFKLEVPKDSPLDAEAVEGIAAFAREHGLSQAQAKAFLEREHTSAMTRAQEMNEHLQGGREWTHRVDAWEAEARKRPSLGRTPQEFGESIAVANEALTKWFPPAMAQLLIQTGYGSHPDVIEGLARLGRSGKQDTLVRGSQGPSPQAPKKRQLEDIYAPKPAGGGAS